MVRASRFLAEKVDTRISLPPRRLTYKTTTAQYNFFAVEYLKKRLLHVSCASSAPHRYDILVIEVLLKLQSLRFSASFRSIRASLKKDWRYTPVPPSFHCTVGTSSITNVQLQPPSQDRAAIFPYRSAYTIARPHRSYTSASILLILEPREDTHSCRDRKPII